MDKEFMKLPITPMGKPRMTQRDVWKKRDVVVRYRDFCDELNLRLPRYELPAELTISFGLPMPKSWSAKKRETMRMMPHDGKPDIDNLLKAFMDAFKTEDKHVYKVIATKYWSESGFISLPDVIDHDK
jgi:Holliday junction resolvase RusA-like endonuclease